MEITKINPVLSPDFIHAWLQGSDTPGIHKDHNRMQEGGRKIKATYRSREFSWNGSYKHQVNHVCEINEKRNSKTTNPSALNIRQFRKQKPVAELTQLLVMPL